jgi:RNA polymerase sigma factor (sigma-70 family)
MLFLALSFLSVFSPRRVLHGKSMNDDQNLLRQYREQGSDAAFGALVNRYVNLVYSAALRKTNDPQLARDASQIVFIDLARKARRLNQNVILAGWLYRGACFAAAKLIRYEARRAAREKDSTNMNAASTEANAYWTQLKPILDDALNVLAEKDRDAVILRFFENKAWREVGDALRLSEDAAQKRVNRALEKLRRILVRNGGVLTTASLASVLVSNAVQSAPSGLNVAISSGSIAAAASMGGSVALLEAFASTKVKVATVCALATALLVPLVSQQMTVRQLRTEAVQFRKDLQVLEEVRLENQRLTRMRAETIDPEQFRASQSELIRLRGEVTLLKSEKAEWARQQAAISNAASTEARIELKGRYRTRDKWADAGLQDAQAALHTVMYALANRDEKRLKECSLGFYKPENETPRIVDSSLTALLPIRILSVAGYQVMSSQGPSENTPGSVHWVSFVLQTEFESKDKDGKPMTQQRAEKWAFECTETGEFKWIPEARAFEKIYNFSGQGNTVAPIK